MILQQKKYIKLNELADYGIQGFEIISYEKKIIHCQFLLADTSLLKDVYNFIVKYFVLKDNDFVESSRTQYQQCKEINSFKNLFTDTMKLVISFFPNDRCSEEYDLELLYDDVMGNIRKRQTYKDSFITIDKIVAQKILYDGDVFENSKSGNIYLKLILLKNHYRAKYYKITFDSNIEKKLNKEKKGEIHGLLHEEYPIRFTIIEDSQNQALYDGKITINIFEKDRNGSEKRLSYKEFPLKKILISPSTSQPPTKSERTAEQTKRQRIPNMQTIADVNNCKIKPAIPRNKTQTTQNNPPKPSDNIKPAIRTKPSDNGLKPAIIKNEYQKLLEKVNVLQVSFDQREGLIEKINTKIGDQKITIDEQKIQLNSQQDQIHTLIRQNTDLQNQIENQTKKINTFEDLFNDLQDLLTPESMANSLLEERNRFSIKLKNMIKKEIGESSKGTNVQYEIKKNEINTKIKEFQNNFKPVSLSDSFINDLNELHDVINYFDIIYPNVDSPEEINKTIRKIGFEISKFYVQCNGIEKDNFLKKYFSDETSEEITVNFDKAMTQLDRIEKFCKNRSFHTEEEAIQKMAELSEHVFGFIEHYQKDILRWHKQNMETNHDCLPEEKLKELFDEIFEKCGIIEIPASVGAQYDTAFHKEFEKTTDPNQPERAILSVLNPGYQIKWTEKKIRKAQVTVNYR